MQERLFFFLLFLFLTFSQCQRSITITGHTFERIPVTVDLSLDTQMAALVQPYKQKLEQEMNEPLVVCESKLIKGKPESTLGNLIADIIKLKAAEHFETTIDFAVVNYGGIRLPYVNQGMITTGMVYELMPFDNTLVIMYLDGPVVMEVINKICINGGWPVAGLQFEIKEDRPQNIRINGEPFDITKKYKMAVADYLANGGDDMDVLKDKKRDDRYILFRDVLIEYFREQGAAGNKITSELSNRIVYAE